MPIGGKLHFKGDKNKKKRNINDINNNNSHNNNINTSTTTEITSSSSSSSSNSNNSNNSNKDINEDNNSNLLLTETQKKHLNKKLKVENEKVKELVKITYRERIENYNSKLASLTEHNDIPRVSAAGNG
mmetsp:Transcript_9682/g.10184  ORF Transcript_9682/g.10184 Transcript_9682/m.10184 type:complete len:129 (+) Transcript_9682:49-435(+)